MATVYAVASAKGGVGKTTTTAALATVLAESGADAVAIDADLGMANLADVIGVTPGEATVHDVLAGDADPTAAVHEGPSGLRVVPGATDLDAYAAADPAGLRGIVEAFDGADYVFVDAGAGLSHDSSLPLAIADETLLVSTPERSALGDTEKTRQLTERLGGTVAGAAVTRVTDDADEVVTALLDAPVLGRVPEDEAVARAAAANRPLLAVAPDAPATRAYRDLARALTGADVEGSGLDDPAADAAAGVGASGGEAEGELDDAAAVDDEPETTADDGPDDEGAEAGEREGADERDDAGDRDDEDIIVADPNATGVAEPGDGDDIIVASESEAANPGAEDADGTTDREKAAAESTDDESDEDAGRDAGEDGESEGDDPDAESDAIPDADETAREATAGPDDGDDSGDGDEAGSRADAGSEAGDDIDDELAGSIPFRDDDSGTMNTVLSEEDGESEADADDEGAASDAETESEAGSEEEAESTPDDDPGEKDGGFFSRLLGR
jgi:septum site-determining protein MinD